MSEIPNVWRADSIKVGARSPNVILKAQAAYLQAIARGILRCEVLEDVKNDQTWLRLDVLAPAAGNVRRTLVRLSYGRDQPYPVRIDNISKTASDENEFLIYLREALGTSDVISVITALLALSNDASATPPPADTTSSSG